MLFSALANRTTSRWSSAYVMSRRSPAGSPSQWNATLPPAPASTWRSTQLKQTLSLPPRKNFAYGGSHSYSFENGSNHVGFRNAEADGLLERYRVEFDPARRKELYRRFQEIVYEEQPYTFLFSPNELYAWDLRFRGVRWYEGMGANTNEWWVPATSRLHP